MGYTGIPEKGLLLRGQTMIEDGMWGTIFSDKRLNVDIMWRENPTTGYLDVSETGIHNRSCATQEADERMDLRVG